ncbi:transposase family protein [Mesorhizobium sp.]|uniref:transposase family protein n=1 Tax=Mesorhizobium sp. TaxID=1871066 RepID=UPI00344E1661
MLICPDPRQCSKVIYPLDEILLLSLLAVVAGAETSRQLANSGKRSSACLGGLMDCLFRDDECRV